MFKWLKRKARTAAEGKAPESTSASQAAARVDPEALLRRVEWKAVRMLDGMLQGDYRTLFRGEGISLAELREYQPHDDVRHIDWNATARMQVPYVREHQEDRDMSAWFLADLSRSVSFGSGATSKRMLCAEFVAIMARLLGRRGNRSGAMIYTGGMRKSMRHIPARAGRHHILHLIDRIANARPDDVGNATDLSTLLDDALQSIRRRSTVFVISDFFSVDGWEKPLARLARRHDVIAIRLADPLESEMPDLGLVMIEDAETGEQVLVDSHDKAFRARFAECALTRETELRAALANAGVDCIELRTDATVSDALMHFVALRKRRAQTSAGTHRIAQAA